jgi:hypothetical protein
MAERCRSPSTGSSSSWSRGSSARCRCGRNHSPGCARRRSSTYAQTRTNAPTTRRTSTGTGCLTTASSSSGASPRRADGRALPGISLYAEARDLRDHPGVGQDVGRPAERMSESHLGSPTAAGEPLVGDMVWLPGGTFRMGSDSHYAEAWSTWPAPRRSRSRSRVRPGRRRLGQCEAPGRRPRRR